MGIINQLFRLFRGESEQQPSTVSSQESIQNHTENSNSETKQLSNGSLEDWSSIEYDGQQYHCQVEESPNGRYQVAFADGRSGRDEPVHGAVFLFEDGGRNFAVKIERPNEIAVSDTGTVAVVDWEFGWGDGGLSGTFHVFDRVGDKRVVETFDSNLGSCAITPDGTHAAVSTLKPDCSTYLFDVESGERIASHENEGGNKQKLVFEETSDGWRLCLANASRDEPTYAIDLSGTVVWRNEKDNLRGDVEELVKEIKQGDNTRTATSDLCAVARQSPREITPYLPVLLDLVEEGTFETRSNRGGDLSVQVDSVFTALADVDSSEYEPHLDRLLENIRGETTPAAAVVSTSVMAELAGQEVEFLRSKYDVLHDLLQHESRDVRQRAVTIIERDVGRIYDHGPDIAERFCERLQLEDDLALLRDLTSALRTLLDERPDAADQVDSIVPRVIELLSVGDGDYQYDDVETYEYKDQTHYDTNHLHRSAPRLIAALAPTYADQLTDGVPDLLNLLRQPGQRNTSLRRASHKALTAIAMHLTGSVDPMLESEFDQLDELLNHTDSEVQIAAIELLVLFGTEDARRKLNEVQKSQNEKLASIATKGIQTLEIATPLDTEVSELTPSGDNAIEQQQNRFEIQRAYEFLQSKNSARKQIFIEEIYSEERNEDADKWWRTIRAGLKSIETVELSGNTYSYIGSDRIKT